MRPCLVRYIAKLARHATAYAYNPGTDQKYSGVRQNEQSITSNPLVESDCLIERFAPRSAPP
jgi:hypothetical protein